MATNKDDKTLLEFDIGVSPNKAIAEINRFGNGFSKRMKDAEEKTKKLDKGMVKFVKQIMATRQHGKNIQVLNKHYMTLGKSINKDVKSLLEMRKLLKGTSGDERKNIFARIKAAQEAMNTRGKVNAKGKVEANLDKAGDSMFNIKELHDRAEEAGEAMSAPLRELFAKDAPALFKRAAGILSYTLDKTVGKLSDKVSKKMFAFSDKTKGHAAKMMQKGGASKVAGAGLKAVSGMSKGFGELFSMLSKIGPIISLASTFMMSFIKIMIDAESAAKEFNKQLLSTSGTAEFMDGMRSTQDGVNALDKTLTASRKGYEDFSNVQWGISKDMAAGFQSALSSEGVSLRRFDDEISKSTGYVKDHATAVQMGVAYSRAFGVSLNEISQLQGDLMANVGMGLDSVQSSFQNMVASASDAGMASNKFFGIVRSFSADLTLFSLRMEDVTKVLKTLSKTMDPREAQRFLQELSKDYTGGITDNLKHAVVAGDVTIRATGSKELEDKLSTLIPQIAQELGKDANDPQMTELIRIIKDPNRGRALSKWTLKQGAKLNSGIMSGITKAMIFSDRQRTQVGRAANMADYGPLAKVNVNLAELRRIMQNSNLQLTDLSSLGDAEMLAAEQSGTATVKKLEGLQALAYGAQQLQAELLQRVQSGVPLSDKDKEMMSKLGVPAGSTDAAAQLEKIFEQDKDLSRTFSSMDRTQAEQLTDGAKQIDFQKQTADFQVSLMDKLGVLSDILLGRIYEVLHAIWLDIEDFIAKFSGKGDFGVAERAAARTGNPELIKAFQDNQGSLSDATKTAIEGVGNQLLAKVEKAQKEAADLKAKISIEKDEGTKKAMQDRLNQLKGTDEVAGVRHKDLYSIAQSKMEGMGSTEVVRILGRMDKATAALGYGTSTGTGAGATTPMASAAQSFAAPAPRAEQDLPTETAQEATTAAIQEQNRTMQTEGIKLDKATVTGPLADSMSKSVYTGTAQALFEYYMYSGLDRNSVAASMGSGVSAQAIQGIGMSGMAPSTALSNLTMATKPAGTSSGLSQGATGNTTTSAPGKPGSVQVELVMKQDLKRFIDARVVDGAANHDRNRRLR